MLTKNQTMTSREIAELTGKQHKDLLESIRNMEPAWEKSSGRKFPPAEYIDEQGKRRPMYELNKSESLYIATKFNDEVRAKLVLRWEKLENEKNLENGSEDVIIFRALTILQDRNLVLTAKVEDQGKVIEEQKPKIEYVDKVLKSQSTHTATVIAKELRLTAYKLNQLLCEMKVIYPHHGVWVLYAQYDNKGYTKTRTHTFENGYGNQSTSIQTVWTEEGRLFIHRMIGKWKEKVA